MTTSQKAIARTTPRRSALTLAKAQVSQHLSRRLPYYITSDEAHQLIGPAEDDRDRLFLRLLWETGLRVSEAINVKLVDVGREGIRVLGKRQRGASGICPGLAGGRDSILCPGAGHRARWLPVSVEERWAHHQSEG